jgi:predicted DCC family thiol-disulfide oxidoreductase YuxK
MIIQRGRTERIAAAPPSMLRNDVLTLRDPRLPTPDAQHPVVLFDGVCNLCNATVVFVIERDAAGRFRFASLQSDAARTLLAGVDAPADLPDSIVLIEGDRLYTQSSAILRIAKGLRFPWPLLYAFMIIPRPLRDWLYSLIAARRYGWFGKRDSCMVPTAELRQRFLG